MHTHRVIYIIGFMGSGKSTAGRKLASLLKWSFIDLDELICKHTGRTIPEIFATDGEKKFREIESNLLQHLDLKSDTVVSTGGGTPCYPGNMDYMTASGLTVYLKLTPPQLKSRLVNAEGDRPLIRNLEPAQLLPFIETKLAERETWYNRSQIIADGFDFDIKALIREVHKITGWNTDM